jgi:hypothetical protein
MRRSWTLAAVLIISTGFIAAGEPTGLLGEYFNTQNFVNNPEGGEVLRVDDMFRDNSDFAVSELPANFRPTGDTTLQTRREDMTIRWTGDVLVDDPGQYQFMMTSDDGNQLFVDGQLLIGQRFADDTLNSWKGQGFSVEYTSAAINLTAGRKAIRINLQQGTGGVGIRIRWRKPDGTVEVIPADHFFPAPQSNQGGGLLRASSAASSGTVNLSTLGTLDWVHFGFNANEFGLDRKTPTATPQICNNATLGVVTNGFDDTTGATVFTWTDGTPTTATPMGGTTTGVRQNQNRIGSGMHFCVPADTTPRRLLVYCGTSTGNIRFEAKLSDFSDAEFKEINATGGDRVYDVRYRASRAGQMLYVRIGTAGATGEGRLFAVTSNLSAPRTTGATYTLNEDGTKTFVLGIVDEDGGPNPNQITLTSPPRNGTLSPLPLTTGTITYTPNPNYNGTDSFSFTVNDGLFTSNSSTINFNIAAQDDGPPMLVADTANTPEQVPTTVAVLANDTVVDTPFTIAITTPPSNGTATLNTNKTITYVSNVGFFGTDTVTYTVTDADGQFASAVLVINVTQIPPTITSPLNVNSISGLLFKYKITATGTIPFTFATGTLPSGLSLVGDTIQGFLDPGSYAINISVTNGGGSDLKTLVINAVQLLPDQDTDGDGFPDEFEIGVGSDPVDPLSTPFTVLQTSGGVLPPGAPLPGGTITGDPFTVTKLDIKLNFKIANRDSISIRGSLPVPAKFIAPSQPVAITAGGASFTGILSSRGSFTSADRTSSFKVGKPKGTLSGVNAPFSFKAKGSLAASFVDEGYNNVDVSKAQGKIVLFVVAGNKYFTTVVPTEYSARVGKNGKAKSLRR